MIIMIQRRTIMLKTLFSSINRIYFFLAYCFQVLVPFVNALVVLDADGDRLLAKYYDLRSKSDQLKTEQFLYKKSKTVLYILLV